MGKVSGLCLCLPEEFHVMHRVANQRHSLPQRLKSLKSWAHIPSALLAQFSAELCDRGLYSVPETMLSSVLSRLFLFKVVSTEIKFSQKLQSSVWTFEMDDQSLHTSLQNSWVSAFVSVF